MANKITIRDEIIERAILIIRGKKVILDADLANIYGVKTKRLNEQVKRNIDRFPADFMFRLTDKEVEKVVANCDHLHKLKYSNINPNAFTEHGALMVSSVLNTATAIQTSVFIVRAFVKLREILSTHEKLERMIVELEKKYDQHISVIYAAIRELMKQEEEIKNRPAIGYKTSSKKKSS